MGFKEYLDSLEEDINVGQLSGHQMKALNAVYDKNKMEFHKVINDIVATHEIEDSKDWTFAFEYLYNRAEKDYMNIIGSRLDSVDTVSGKTQEDVK